MRLLLPTLVLSLAAGLTAQGDGFYRFPTTQKGSVYFTAEGDLWSAPVSGGKATRLTTHPAQEIRASVSPDGKWLAFSATYEGPMEVYVMPVSGGLPTRLSFEGVGSQVLGWTPKGEVLYVHQAPQGPNGQRVISTVHPTTLKRTTLPLADANEACLDDAGKAVFFTRMGNHMTNDNVRNYRGGAAAELWRYDLVGGQEAVKLPLDVPAKRPMWWKGRLYFVCDKGGCDNLWSVKPDGTDARQLTRHHAWEVRTPTMGDGRIVYQQGADLRCYDVEKGEDHPIPLQLTSDFDQQRERLIRRPLDFQDNTAFALNGEKVVFTARGQVAVAGLQGVRRVEVTIPKGSRVREAVLSKDGKWIYGFCDAQGEQQIWRFPADGTPGGKVLTTEPGVARVGLFPSPDGTLLAHTDRRGNLYLLNLTTGDNKRIDTEPHGQSPDVVWSGDGKTLVILRSDSDRQIRQLVLHDVATHKQATLTSDKYESTAPAFTPDGRWLYFLSDRSFQVVNGSPWGDRNMGPYFDRRTKLYALALQEGTRFPFAPKTELDVPEAPGPKPDAKEPKSEKPEKDKPAIQWEGLEARLFEVPLAPGNYSALKTDGKRLYFMERDGRASALKSLEITNAGATPEVFATDVRGFDLSADGKKIMLSKSSGPSADHYIVDAGPKAPGDLSKCLVQMGDWTFTVDPRTEWRQMFADAWRMHRDHFFDAKLRGVDWAAMRKKYEPLVDRVTDRAELNDLLGQMTGELGALHSQIRPGELRQAQDGLTPAFLGATLSRVAEGYRIDHIYRTEPELPSEAAPLARPGVGAREGDIITTVNGRPVLEARDISDLLRNKAGQQVLLGLKRGTEDLKPVVVTPVALDRQNTLRYADWEEGCRVKVDKASGGKIGYLHLRAMGPGDINTFAREFYAQFNREGLIIDVRRNNGGNIDSWVIEKLLRRTWAFWGNGHGQFLGTNMQQTFRGHLVVLVDELTYSDGETFAAGIKHLGLGPLVGRRTAGAGVWLTDSNTLVDGGMARVAEWPQFLTKDGAWAIEGVGVAPDIEVVNPPKETFEGRDRQLETALKLLQDKLAKEPVPPLKPQAIPSLSSGKQARS